MGRHTPCPICFSHSLIDRGFVILDRAVKTIYKIRILNTNCTKPYLLRGKVVDGNAGPHVGVQGEHNVVLAGLILTF